MSLSYTTGGVTRRFELGTLAAGLPPPPPGSSVLSLAGWGHRSGLLAAPELIRRGTETPRLWLNDAVGTLIPPVYQRFSVSGGPAPRLIRRNGCTLGSVYEDADATYAMLTGVLPADPSASPERQTASVFETIEDALRDAGMAFTDVVRTWLYLDRLLDWYDTFNKARDAFFHSRHVYDHMVPASTGIGSANIIGTAIVANAIAVKPKAPGRVSVTPLPSPLQCAAIDYGSSFSRAVELALPAYRTIFVSGTASIEPGGKTAYVGDPDKQLDLTLDVIAAILRSRGMDWPDVSRSVLYLKEESYLPLWRRKAAERGLEAMPCSPVHADVCRDDLLVEMELDAIRRN